MEIKLDELYEQLIHYRDKLEGTVERLTDLATTVEELRANYAGVLDRLQHTEGILRELLAKLRKTHSVHVASERRKM